MPLVRYNDRFSWVYIIVPESVSHAKPRIQGSLPEPRLFAQCHGIMNANGMHLDPQTVEVIKHMPKRCAYILGSFFFSPPPPLRVRRAREKATAHNDVILSDLALI